MIHCMSISGYDENHIYPSLPLHPASMRVLNAWNSGTPEVRHAPTCDEHVGLWIRGALQYSDDVSFTFDDIDQDDTDDPMEPMVEDLQEEFYDSI